VEVVLQKLDQFACSRALNQTIVAINRHIRPFATAFYREDDVLELSKQACMRWSSLDIAVKLLEVVGFLLKHFAEQGVEHEHLVKFVLVDDCWVRIDYFSREFCRFVIKQVL
jgi:hypothetical protein